MENYKENVTFKYFATQRILQLGAFPKNENLMQVVNFNEPTYCVAIGNKAYGYVEYSKPLSDKECSDYELTKDYDSLHRMNQPFVRSLFTVPAMEREETDEVQFAKEIEFYTEKLCDLGKNLLDNNDSCYLLIKTETRNEKEHHTNYYVVKQDDQFTLCDTLINDSYMITKNGLDMAYDIHKGCITEIGYGSFGVQTIDGKAFPFVNTIQQDVYVLEDSLLQSSNKRMLKKHTQENGTIEIPESWFNRLKEEKNDLLLPIADMLRDRNEMNEEKEHDCHTDR